MRVFSATLLRSRKLLLAGGCLLAAACGLLACYRAPIDAGPQPYPITYYYPEKPSVAMGFFAFMLRHVLRPAAKGLKEFESGEIFRRPDLLAPKPKIDADLATLSVAQVQGRQVFTLRPAPGAQPSGKVVLFLHGGAYVYTFGTRHWELMQQVVAQTGHTVVAPDYPLAPQHTYPEVFALVQAVYQDLVAQVGAQNVLILGDSAGGGLALALAEKLKLEQQAQPAQLVLLSPWLDATLQNPALKPVEPLDPMLSAVQLRQAARAYAGPTPLSNYQLSPLLGDLTGLPRISVFIGTHDIFIADARKFKQLMARQGTPLNYFEYGGAFHDWVLTGSPEGKQAQQQLLRLLK